MIGPPVADFDVLLVACPCRRRETYGGEAYELRRKLLDSATVLRSTKSCDIHALKVKSIVRNASSEPLEWYGQQHSVRELCWIPLMLLPARLLTPPPLMASSRKDEEGEEGERGRRKRNMKTALRLVGDAKAVSSSVIRSPMPANLVRYRF